MESEGGGVITTGGRYRVDLLVASEGRPKREEGTKVIDDKKTCRRLHRN